MPNTIRPALARDVPQLERIARAAYAPYVPLIGTEPPPMLQPFAEDVAAGHAWVVGSPVVGYVVARARGDDWLIENVAVAPNAQRAGQGRRLIAFVEEEGRRRGFAQIVLYTHAKMAGNLALYPRLGYRETKHNVERGMDRVHFAKSLG